MHEYTAILSENGARFADRLSADFDIVLLPPDSEISPEVASHADMTLFVLADTAIVPQSYRQKNESLFEAVAHRTGLLLTDDTSPRGKKYPEDVALNVLLCDRFAFSLERATSRSVMRELERHKITHVNVRQGYAACSSLAFTGSVISADRGILRAARSCALDCLEISRGGITLKGLSEGFIGGASGVCENKIYFLGNIERHCDGLKLERFAYKRGFECVCLGDSTPEDIGGIRFVKNMASIGQ